MAMGENIIGWNFDNSYAQLPELFFQRQLPTPVVAPELVLFNRQLAEYLGLNAQKLQSRDGAALLTGNRTAPGSWPLAQAYAGHQFGHFTMLGDGRAILLGEQITPAGDRFDIQLKGAGRTPYSRQGDGRAALGPMLREYIISEAMTALGIPSTRSLAVAITGETVYRETAQRGAVLTRVAASHLRVGTFQYAAQWGSLEDLRLLADYTLSRHFAGLAAADNRYLALLTEVVRRQAWLIAQWQLTGFVHGVMNTDNMAVSGETIDYGPCAFIDVYDPATVFSSIDLRGRYAFGRQPHMAEWNLARLAEALLPLLHPEQKQAVKLAENALSGFMNHYQDYWLAGMRKKLGLANAEAEDEALIKRLLALLEQYQADYTNTFRSLTLGLPANQVLSDAAEFLQWYELWQLRLRRQPEAAVSPGQLMKNSNPAVIPRNHRVEAALEAAGRADYRALRQLLAVLAEPYAYSAEQVAYATLPETPDRVYKTFCGT